MKTDDPPLTFSPAEVRRALGVTASQFRVLLASCNITLKPVELHYTDERPRKTNYRKPRDLTGHEVKRLVKHSRAAQGAKALARR